MGRKNVVLLPKTQKNIETMGYQIKLARLRRKLPVELVAKRAGVSRASVWAVEKGSPSVAIGIYAAVLLAIGMPDELTLVAKDDVLGRTLQDLDLPVRKRAPKEDKTDEK
ncbi:MAG: hypothetical protein IJ181_09105 [Acidaminococcaceae bacterium]|nr:hypothetical protein [Acidaminococcaceae bacterium]